MSKFWAKCYECDGLRACVTHLRLELDNGDIRTVLTIKCAEEHIIASDALEETLHLGDD